MPTRPWPAGGGTSQNTGVGGLSCVVGANVRRRRVRRQQIAGPAGERGVPPRNTSRTCCGRRPGEAQSDRIYRGKRNEWLLGSECAAAGSKHFGQARSGRPAPVVRRRILSRSSGTRLDAEWSRQERIARSRCDPRSRARSQFACRHGGAAPKPACGRSVRRRHRPPRRHGRGLSP